MNFLENLSKKTAEATGKVAQKTKDLSEIAKLNGLVCSAETKIKDTYNEIGKLYAERHEHDPEAEFADLVNVIQELSKNVDEYKAQIREIKGIACCPKCGAEISRDAKFCPSCGASILDGEGATQEDWADDEEG